uniref:DUF6340 family protein n=1 Tax=uncultured Draconibacterium sp. TaxID=1573823 RepID=UPI003216C2A7
MKPISLLSILIIILLLNQGCNTLYNTKVIDIEIVEPGKISIPGDYKTVAVRYNNCNISPNPNFQYSYFLGEPVYNNENIDSIASKVYFDLFVNELRKQFFFERVIKLEGQDFSMIKVRDTIRNKLYTGFDSVQKEQNTIKKQNFFPLSETINRYSNFSKTYSSEKFLHPHLGLYQPEELQKIADATQADLLLSLDYFYTIEATFYDDFLSLANKVVQIRNYWNLYDLNSQEFCYYINKADTVSWKEKVYNPKQITKTLPSRKDAILNAADITGVNTVNYFVPHWIQVQRMYYSSGHVELQKTEKLIKDGNWEEAVKIWKANANNPNKSIAAKSKFNMGLACEMQGNLKAAVEWVVESYHIFGQKNKEHYTNCINYIHILGQRQQDIKIIEAQFEQTSENQSL